MIKRARYLVALVNKMNEALDLLDEVAKIDLTNGDIYMLKGSIYSGPEEIRRSDPGV